MLPILTVPRQSQTEISKTCLKINFGKIRYEYETGQRIEETQWKIQRDRE